MPKDIRINQQWRTRDGSIVRVTLDRGPGAFDGWRWVLSNGFIAHEDDGRTRDSGRRESRSNTVRGPPGLGSALLGGAGWSPAFWRPCFS
jgi:hypothetical protein